jgi:hypothetical protein
VITRRKAGYSFDLLDPRNQFCRSCCKLFHCCIEYDN